MKKNAMFHKLTALTLAGLLSVSVSGSALNVLAAGQTPSGIIDCCYDLGFLSKDLPDDADYVTTFKEKKAIAAVSQAIRNC